MAGSTRKKSSANHTTGRQVTEVLKANAGKLLLVAIAFSLWFVFGSDRRKKQKPTYTAACTKTARSLPLMLAREKGFFETAGLPIELTDSVSAKATVDDLVAGKLHMAAALPILALCESELKKAGSLKVAYFIVADSGGINDAILVRKGSPITKPKHLQGKTLAVLPGKANVVFARLVLKGLLGSKANVRIVELSVQDQLFALEKHDVQALLAFQPLVHMLQAKGSVRVLLENPIEAHVIAPVPLAAAVVSGSFVREHPKIARGTVNAAQKAIDSIRADKKEAAHVAARVFQLDKDAAAAMVIPAFWKLTEIRKDQADHIQRFADLLTTEGIIAGQVDIRAMFLKKLRAAGKTQQPAVPEEQ